MPDQVTIVMVRHANRKKDELGVSMDELSPLGEEQVQRATDRLLTLYDIENGVYHSPTARTEKFAQAIADRRESFYTIPYAGIGFAHYGFNEAHINQIWGQVKGTTVANAISELGTVGVAVRAQMVGVLGQLAIRHRGSGKVLVCVSHGTTSELAIPGTKMLTYPLLGECEGTEYTVQIPTICSPVVIDAKHIKLLD